MRKIYNFLLILFLTFSLYSFSENEADIALKTKNYASKINNSILDSDNPITLNIDLNTNGNIVVELLEFKDYLVNSDVLQLKTIKVTDDEINNADYDTIHFNFSQYRENSNWRKVVKVLVNDSNVIKIDGSLGGGNGILLVGKSFDRSFYKVLMDALEIAIDFN